LRKHLRDKRNIYFILSQIILLTIVTGLFVSFSASKKELGRLRVQRDEMVLLKHEFLVLKKRIDTVEKEKSLAQGDGIIPVIEDVFSSIGLKDRIKSIKPAGNKEMSSIKEEDVEVYVEKASMNEMVNLFYKIENAPIMLILKKLNIKTSFEKPDLMNLTVVITHAYEK
jgi:hypothetical protein